MAKGRRVRAPSKKGAVKPKKQVNRKVVQVAGSAPAEERKWRAENDLRTLREAQEISGDKSRVAAARAVAKKEMAALKKAGKD